VVSDFAVDVERLGDGVGVEGEGHKGSFAVVDGEGLRVGQCVQEGFAEGEGGAEDGGVDVLGLLVWDERGVGDTYFALQDAEAALEDVHDGVVDAFPVIDDFVVVDSGDEEDGAVVFAGLFYALCLCLIGVPSALLGGFLFGLCDEAEELNVAGGEEIPASVNVDDSLAGLDALALDQLVELALFFLDRAEG
jgi:hypothetical protein